MGLVCMIALVVVFDDTDGDDVGPSHCDPDEPNERGVFEQFEKFMPVSITSMPILKGLDMESMNQKSAWLF